MAGGKEPAVNAGAGEIAVRVRIRGRVQGVFYRGWCVETAAGLGLRGGVRNLGDGTVEAVIAGRSPAVEAMIARCRQGPAMARVTGVERAPCDPPTAAGFHQRTKPLRGSLRRRAGKEGV